MGGKGAMVMCCSHATEYWEGQAARGTGVVLKGPAPVNATPCQPRSNYTFAGPGSPPVLVVPMVATSVTASSSVSIWKACMQGVGGGVGGCRGVKGALDKRVQEDTGRVEQDKGGQWADLSHPASALSHHLPSAPK